METDEDSRSSSNSSGTSNSTSNGPASPPQESNDQLAPVKTQQRSRSSSPESNSCQEKPEITSPTPEENASNQNQSRDDEEELELSDVDEESSKPKKADISHEDLSDISDLESNSPSPNFTDLRQKLESKRLNGSSKDNDEDELDFEDDEVRDVSENSKRIPQKEEKSVKEDGENKSERGSIESGEELEDGEVTDGDDKRPEESEPKAVCRFFTRGQCTWGMSCRFLHPGTTDKGNYTMFDMVRPIPVPQAVPIMPAFDYRIERPMHHMPQFAGPSRAPPAGDSESAWERGLRTAKEMMRKANKRKEQDSDFDEKKMNLSGPPDEIEKDPFYVRGSPEPVPIVSVKTTPPFERIPRERPRYGYSPPPKYARGGPAPFEEDLYGRAPRFRELPSHRMPHYEDDDLNKRRTVRSTREVIVEKADEWSDPWARKTSRRESAGRENRRGRERSYSSNSSYSSSSATSRSRSSSESSGSPRRKRFESHRTKEIRKPVRQKSRSNSLKRRHSPPARSRVIEKKAISPVPNQKRKKPISPPTARTERGRVHGKKKRDSSSGSGSSSGSESGSESYSSSTSDSKGKKKREKIVVERKPSSKADLSKKRATPPKDDKKDKATSEKAAAAAKMKSTRREELLKQLKAVEDAIARKKSKIN